MADRLTRQELNRATLARQLLLERAAMPVLDAVEHLGGLQAQTTHSWYQALWARLDPFDPVETGRLLEERALVRLGLQRGTIHLVSARDCLWMRPLVDPVMEKGLSSFVRQLPPDLDRDAVAAAARELVEERPLTGAQLGRALVQRFPGRDEQALAQLARARLALVQVPPRGVWGRSGQAAHTTAEAWLGQPLDDRPDPERLVLRYLAAFGPATPMDAQTWSGLTRLGEVFEGLRGQLVTFTGEDGRELFDLPDAPRPGADVPAPVRFLPDFDNLLLSHADRRRFMDADSILGLW